MNFLSRFEKVDSEQVVGGALMRRRGARSAAAGRSSGGISPHAVAHVRPALDVRRAEPEIIERAEDLRIRSPHRKGTRIALGPKGGRPYPVRRPDLNNGGSVNRRDRGLQ
jgi:hypothetical protein